MNQLWLLADMCPSTPKYLSLCQINLLKIGSLSPQVSLILVTRYIKQLAQTYHKLSTAIQLAQYNIKYALSQIH